MTTAHNSSLETSRTKRLEELIHKLEHLSQSSKGTLQEPNEALELFDDECEQLLKDLYGPEHERLQFYKYATLGEAEAIINLPESAQLATERNEFKKTLQQRRQVLQACILELQEAETTEVEALTGEDREDPPAFG